MEGQTLGNYRIIKKIGIGSIFTAYEAFDPDSEQDLIVEIMRPEILPNRKLYFNIEQGWKNLVGKLKHPNIASVLSYNEDDKFTYLVTKYIKNSISLSTRIKKGNLSPKEASHILNQIASALDHIHLQGILHRDITSMCIILDAAGIAYLTSFGCAAFLDSKGSCINNNPFGAASYMSPEMTQAGALLTSASDIYSLGIVVYEMLSGRTPFSSSIPHVAILKKLNDPMPLLRNQKSSFSELTERVVLKALSNEPKSRYQSAGSMAAAFAQSIKDSIFDNQVSSNSKRTILPQKNPWISGSFYLTVSILMLTLLAFISINVPWYALIAVFIGGLLTIVIVGIFQLKSDDTLNEESFLTLVIETFKRIPLLKLDELSKKK